MFNERIRVGVLCPDEVTFKVADDISDLLQRQHSEAMRVDKKKLIEFIQKSTIVAAWNDERVVAIGTLVKTSCISHEFVSIHNLVIHEGYDVFTIGKRIVEILIESAKDVEFIEAGVWLQVDGLKAILIALRFIEKPDSRYRLRLEKCG